MFSLAKRGSSSSGGGGRPALELVWHRSSHPCCPATHACRLNLGVAQLLEKNLEYLNDCLDDVMVEQVRAGAGG